MKDDLKRFIEAHRDAFDDSEPSHELPGRILAARELKKRSLLRRMPWTSLAAATLSAGLLLAIAYRNHVFTAKQSPEQQTVDASLPKTDLKAQADSSLRMIDYEQALHIEAISLEVIARQSELERLRKDDPELYQRFLQDLALLDSNYLALRDMLERMPNQRQVMQAMEENLRTRLRMLERQDQLIQESKEFNKPRS